MSARRAPLRYALVGCGQVANAVHLPALVALRQQGVVDLVAVCDWDAARARKTAARFGVARHFERWPDMVAATGAEALSICLPPGPNADVASAAIEDGLHVLCEKPPGRDLAHAERMAAAAAAHSDRIGMVAFNRRHAPLYRAAIERSLAFGRPHAFYGRFTRSALGSPPSNTAADWITSDGSHVLDLAVATIGFPRTVNVARMRVGAGPDNSWTIHLHGDSGSAVLFFDFAAGRRLERFEWAGPGYDAILELPDKAEWCQQGSTVERWTAFAITQSREAVVNYGFVGEYRAFIDAIRGDGPRPATDFGYAVDFMRLVQAILECPSGETRTIARGLAEMEREASAGRDRAGSVAPVRRARPVVRLMQSAAVQSRFFTMEDLTRVSRLCDLRVDADAQNSLEGVEAIVTGWSSTFPTAAQLDAARSLKLVVVMGAAVGRVHPDRLLSRGVTICNTADAIAASVAEHCLLLALAGLRQLTEVNRTMHGGGWPPNNPQGSLRTLIRRARRVMAGTTSQPWSDLRGQTVGLVGWGHVARHMARLLQPFECPLLVASSAVSEEDASQYRLKVVSLGEALAASTVVSIHKGLSERSRGLIGKAELALVRSGSILINTARGALIEESALVERARRGDIVVGLDVFDVEPLPRRHPLRRLPNVILTPHSASATPECQHRVGKQALDLICAWINGEPLPAITASRLANMT